MFKKILIGALGVSLTIASAISLANEGETSPAVQAAVINPASPATYMGFINPQTHKQFHDTMLNPAQWNQFAQPQFYMQMANPQVWTQWMNPASYQVMMDPNTYMHWINPATMMQELSNVNPGVFMNPANYQQFTQANTFAAWWNPASYNAAAVMGQDGNWFNMGSMSNPAKPAPQEKADNGEG